MKPKSVCFGDFKVVFPTKSQLEKNSELSALYERFRLAVEQRQSLYNHDVVTPRNSQSPRTFEGRSLPKESPEQFGDLITLMEIDDALKPFGFKFVKNPESVITAPKKMKPKTYWVG